MLLMLAGVNVSFGQTTLAEYFNVEDSDSVVPTNVATGISGTNFEISSGSVNTGDSDASSWTRPLPYAQGNSGWGSDSPEEAKYFSFKLKVAGAESFTLSELSFEERATDAGPSTLTVTINGITVLNDTIPDSETRLHEIDLSSGFGTDFKEITEAEVRIIGWNDGSRSTTGNGQFRINGIIVEGDVVIDNTATIPYTQNFADFVFDANTAVNTFGAENEWQFTSTENELEYIGDWGFGSSSGIRGNSNVLGYQHTGSTGIFTARLLLRNVIGNPIEDLTITYDGRVERDDQGRSPEWAVIVNDSVTTELSYSTEDGINKIVSHTIQGLNIEDGEFIHIEWKSDRGDGGGSSKQIGIGNVKVSAAGEHVVSLTGNEGFRLLSTPAEATYSDFLNPIYTQGATGANTENGDPNIFIWDNSSTGDSEENWIGVTDLSENIPAGTGFLANVFKDDEFGVGGTFPKTLTIGGAEHDAINMAVNSNEGGWSLLGNPFASPVTFDGLEKQNLTDIVYVWDVNDGDGTQQTDPNHGAGSWKTYSSPTGTGDLTNGIISSFQGFFVQNNNGGPASVNFIEGAKTPGGSFRGKEAPKDLVRLELTGKGLHNSTWISFSENGSMRQIYGDALQLMPFSTSYALLATKKTDGLFDISIVPVPDKDFELPLEVDATVPGTYTLKATDFSTSFEEILYLEDRHKNTIIELNENTEYEFSLEGHSQKAVPDSRSILATGPAIASKSTPGTSISRFYITSQTSVNLEGTGELPKKLSLSQNYPNPFNPTTVISYDISQQTHVRLAVYDLLGR
ncbi:hypothetical protein BH23BAC3_BH23BAC3_21840 [soil metagenome]